MRKGDRSWQRQARNLNLRMESIVLIPGIIATLRGLRLGPARLFLNFYLPMLMILPEYYRWTVPESQKSRSASLSSWSPCSLSFRTALSSVGR